MLRLARPIPDVAEFPVLRDARWWVGVDIGGTFTDLIAVNADGNHLSVKVPSSAEPEQAVLDGLQALQSNYSVDLQAVSFVGHGSTVGTNALIERTGANVGLIVTAGFEDVLVLGRLGVGAGSLQATKSSPIVPRQLVRGVDERVRADGATEMPLDRDGVLSAVRDLLRAGAETVAVCFLHADRFPNHEQLAVRMIREAYPNVSVWASSEVWPEVREFERALITSVNAYIGTRVAGYYESLERQLDALGCGGAFLASQGNGGVAEIADVRRRPVITLQSGPASGVAAAWQIGQRKGLTQVIAVDVGGTSTDVAILDRGIGFSTETRIGDNPVMLPMVDVSSVGAGGGSIVSVDAGVLKVGPTSAGAFPGPAAYGRGGAQPTLTDAYVVLGILGGGALGGSVTIDAQAAAEAFLPIAADLGISIDEVADAAIEIASSAMYAEVTRLSAAKGVDHRDFSLVVYGGAGPTQGFLLADELGCGRVLVPTVAGLLCALGCITSDARAEFVKTIDVAPLGGAGRLEGSIEASVQIALGDLSDQALAWCEASGFGSQRRQFEASAEVRYVGQTSSLSVPIRMSGFQAAQLVREFHSTHETTFGHADPEAPVEVLRLRMTAIGRLTKPALSLPARAQGPLTNEVRTVQRRGVPMPCPVFRRDRLPSGFSTLGPAIVEQYDTTILVPPSWRIQVDPDGLLVGDRLPDE